MEPGKSCFPKKWKGFGKGFCFCFCTSLIQAQGVGTERKCGLRLFHSEKAGVRLTVCLCELSAGLDFLARTQDVFIGEIA